MKIEQINIKNYRCFADVSLTLDPKLTVIVALNGQGKSALLDAIKIALWPFVAGFDLGSTTNDVTGIHIDDVRREIVQAHEMDWRLPSMIDAAGQIQVRQLVLDKTPPYPSPRQEGTGLDIPTEFASDVRWEGRRHRDSIKKNTKTKNVLPAKALDLTACAQALEKRIFSDAPTTPDDLPMLGYYGTGRLWSQKKLSGMSDKADSETLSRTFAYRDCLDPSSSYKHFVQWYTRVFKAFRDAQIRNLEKRLPLDADVPYALIGPIRAVQQAIDVILTPHTGWKTLEYSAEHEELVLLHPEYGQLKVSQLSDGIRNMLALVGDIAFRCCKLNAHHGDAATLRTHGIVLIDEVDMHLHPAWQQTVLPDLSTAFPCIQFIVSTHSPQVLTTVDRRCIRRLDTEYDDETGRSRTVIKPVSQQTLGVASSETLAEVMGIDPVPDVEPARQLSQYQALIQQDLHNSEAGQLLREKLDEHFGPQHPLMLDCQRLIRLQVFKQQFAQHGRADA